MNHLDDDLELYALGMLDERERERVDVHCASCDACLVRLGRAERAVATLVDARHAKVTRRPVPTLIASALGVALAACIALVAVMHRQLDDDGSMLALLATSHFEHVPFADTRGNPMPAKVVYERHGRWYAIVAAGSPAWHVVLLRANGTRQNVAENFARRGAGALLTIANPPPLRAIELDDDGGNRVATAKLHAPEP